LHRILEGTAERGQWWSPPRRAFPIRGSALDDPHERWIPIRKLVLAPNPRRSTLQTDGVVPDPDDQAEQERLIASVRAALSGEEFK